MNQLTPKAINFMLANVIHVHNRFYKDYLHI